MGLFNKNTSAGNAAAGNAKKAAKPSELAKTLDESVWASSENDFKQNKSFIIRDADGSTKYVALLFDTMQVGGIAGKAARRDESKGSLIEAIKTGRVKTYLRIEMLCDNCILIIPDEETILNMDEFALFANVTFTICTVDTNGLVTAKTMNGTDADDDPEMVVDFKTVKNAVLNKKGADALFSKATAGDVYGGSETADDAPDTSSDDMFNNGSSGASASDDDAEELPDDFDEPDDLPDDLPEDLPDDEDIPDIDDDDLGSSVDDDFDELGAAQPDDSYTDDSANDILGHDDGSEADAQAVTAYSDVTSEVVDDFISHRYYSDDLNLEISTDAFDTHFMHGNPYVPFNENRGEGWLNEYLSNFSRDANVRMERLHNENLYRLRDTYLRIIRKNCESIVKNLDFSDENTQYGRIRAAIERNKNVNEASLPEIIAERREALEQKWYEELEQYAESAALEAKKAYEDEHRQQHDRMINDIDHEARDEIEREYQNGLRHVNDDRRREAGKLLDLAVSEALKEVAKLYDSALEAEQKEYLRLQNEMTRFIDANRKDEKVRIEVLAEENRQVRRANEVRKEYTAKIKVMSAEFDMKKTMLQADIDRMNREHDEELKNYEREWSDKVQDQKDRAAELEARIDDLLKQYAELDEKKTQEFADRMEALKQENKMKDENIEHIVITHKRSNLISIFLVVAILIASIGIGFMIGSLANIRNSSNIEQDLIYQQYQEEANRTSNDKPSESPTENTESDSVD